MTFLLWFSVNICLKEPKFENIKQRNFQLDISGQDIYFRGLRIIRTRNALSRGRLLKWQCFGKKKTRRCPILAITVRTWRTKVDYSDHTCRFWIDWDLSTPAFHGLLLTKSMHWVYLKSWHDFLPLKYFFDMICCRFYIQPLVAAALYLWTIQTHITSSLCCISKEINFESNWSFTASQTRWSTLSLSKCTFDPCQNVRTKRKNCTGDTMLRTMSQKWAELIPGVLRAAQFS